MNYRASGYIHLLQRILNRQNKVRERIRIVEETLVKKKYTTMTIITRREKINVLHETLIELGIPGMTTTMVEGNGQQLGEISYMQDGLQKAKLIPKVMVEVNYEDMDTEKIIETICNRLRTNIMGDGKIFITENEGYVVRVSDY